MSEPKRLTVTIPLIGNSAAAAERYLADAARMGADSVLLMAPFDNICRSLKPVKLSQVKDGILPPTPAQRVCDLPSLDLIAHWAEVFRYLAPRYRSAGMEPYFWYCHTIGHGGELSTRVAAPFQRITGTSGRESSGCYCPLDEGFRQYLRDAMAAVASAEPALILLDDDFRLHYHMPNTDLGCFCPLHVERFNRRWGSRYHREELAAGVEAGGELRSQWLAANGGTLLELAAELEQAVHTVSPATRLGVATAPSHWLSEGCDAADLARALAGKTSPYLRLSGAPYAAKEDLRSLGYTIEFVKFQQHHLAGMNIETAGEADTYPHSAFHTSGRLLGTYLTGLRAAGVRGMVHYPFPFSATPDMESTYVELAARRGPYLAALDRHLPEDFIFRGVCPVVTFQNLHETPITADMTPRERSWPGEPLVLRTLARFGIPTAFPDGGHSDPVFFSGRHGVSLDDKSLNHLLNRGAVIDAAAAEWMVARGLDIGVAAVEPLEFLPAFERFSNADFSPRFHEERIWLLSGVPGGFRGLNPKPGAAVAGWYCDGASGRESPAALAWERGRRRILVLGADLYGARGGLQAVHNRAKAEQLRCALEWMGAMGSTVDTVDLHMTARQRGSEWILTLQNLGNDPCVDPQIRLVDLPDQAGITCLRPDSTDLKLLNYTVGGARSVRLGTTIGSGELLLLRYTRRNGAGEP